MTVVGSASASATGPTIELEHSNLQQGELTLLYPDTNCPNAASGKNFAYVRGTFTDSNNQTFSNLPIATSAANGAWTSGAFVIPTGAALGIGSLDVYCTHSSTGGSPNRTFDPAVVTVIGQTTEITVDRVNVWHEAQFTSVTTCDANTPVNIQVHGQFTQTAVGSAHYNVEITDTVTTNSSGMWSYSVQLTPGNGFYYPYAYTLRATCENSAGEYKYGSYIFNLKGDQYVALGDSYSSGLGSGNYTLGKPSCYRSLDSYPFYVAQQLSIDAPNSQACAGAVTDDLSRGAIDSWLSPMNSTYGMFRGQFSQLSANTEYVTLTIGGNDVGFADVVRDCVEYLFQPNWSCSTSSSLQSTLSTRLDALAGSVSGTGAGPNGRNIHSIASVITAIHAVSPDAKIYIAGYPHLFGEDTSEYVADGDAPGGYKCVVNDVVGANVSLWDAEFFNNAADNLNEVIEDAVTVAQQGSSPIDVTYVSPSTFSGHGVCDTSVPYINDALVSSTLVTQPESFHPNVDGMQAGYGAAFLAAMSD